jgi:hypothetical protein
MIYVLYDPDVFKSILKSNHLSIRKITNPDNEMYCGINQRTIVRSNKNGAMSIGTFQSIMEVIDISKCVIAMSKSQGIELLKENVSLKKQLEKIFTIKESAKKVFTIKDGINRISFDRVYDIQIIGIFSSLKNAKDAICEKYKNNSSFQWITDTRYSVTSKSYICNGDIIEQEINKLF